ncbi:TetR/AcrR family transcriptional regulator [Paenibacillus sp. YN15]|uniref:TetR/AcrR family transcriptional regulator n=1 Tax=Paenibacillus sp. YN15 TaxID=1742774 RepID=UPI000DCB62B6|nr:TetR/AcrR family transcriptional regulator [Paenibacillus sp. YN15]RAV01784.1 TetR/AcrR family transcriptional regulator [Paenibacillus sp. YN15]
MKKAEEMKERIIRSTIRLIEQGNGNIGEITTRMIAEEAGIGISLLHYHFQTKERLVELCVQRIITGVIEDFRPSIAAADTQLARVKAVARQVADFLAANPAISRISILGDLNHPAPGDNTALTMAGFAAAWRGGASAGEQDCKPAVFALTALMQAAFLRKELSKELFGYDMENKEERDRFIGWMADRLFGSDVHES